MSLNKPRPRPGTKYLYISSKMTNMPDLARDAFRAKATELRADGSAVWNPHEHQPKRCSTWADFIRDDIGVLERRCDGIYMFGRWYRSQGALVELLSAHRIGLSIVIEQWWLLPLQWILNRTSHVEPMEVKN